MTENGDERPYLEEKLSELEILRQSLEATKAKEKDLFDQLLRLNAEFQNFRRRSETRVTDSRRAGKEEVLLQIISLADGLIQAEVSSRQATDVESLKKGLSLVRDQFEKFLADQGLEPIKSKGQKLDPHFHEAISRVVMPELEEGTVVDEIQRGYILKGQLVRPSRVTVSTKTQETEPAHVKEETHNG